ncbi:MAG: hypothetical protein RL381_425 [Actinomycetota bacterium]|jgi:hypothetical protein
MKRLALSIALILAVTPHSTAAPKSVTLKKINLVATTSSTERVFVTGKSIILMGTSEGPNSNIQLAAVDAQGIQQWQKIIDSGVDEVALVGAIDQSGNLWIAGASSTPLAVESGTAQVAAENPDGVVSEPVANIRNDLTLLTLWKVSSSGELLATYSQAQIAPPLVTALSVNASGATIIGSLREKPFVISATSTGVFGKAVTIGTSKTLLNSVIRNSDGSASIFGASSEALFGKKLAGVRDGVLLKVSKSGAITTLVRSSAPKADRAWLASSTKLALTGYVKTGSAIESAFTQFSSAFAPQWTLRIPSLGNSSIVTAGTTTYGALATKSAIAGVLGWKPTAPSVAVLAFDSKGAISAAFGSSEITEIISLGYSKELGVIGFARAANQSNYIFTVA